MLATVAACASHTTAATTPATFTVTGTIAIGGYGRSVGSCDGSRHPGSTDLAPGGRVAVYDAAGKVVAVGVLAEGVASSGTCWMPFTVTGVPVGAGPYAVQVNHRRRVIFSQAQAGNLALTLGSG